MFSIVFFLFMDMGTSGELIFSILKGRPKGWKWGGGLIRGWKFPKDILLLVGLEFISVVSDTNVMTGMTYIGIILIWVGVLKLWVVGHLFSLWTLFSHPSSTLKNVWTWVGLGIN